MLSTISTPIAVRPVGLPAQRVIAQRFSAIGPKRATAAALFRQCEMSLRPIATDHCAATECPLLRCIATVAHRGRRVRREVCRHRTSPAAARIPTARPAPSRPRPRPNACRRQDDRRAAPAPRPRARRFPRSDCRPSASPSRLVRQPLKFGDSGSCLTREGRTIAHARLVKVHIKARCPRSHFCPSVLFLTAGPASPARERRPNSVCLAVFAATLSLVPH